MRTVTVCCMLLAIALNGGASRASKPVQNRPYVTSMDSQGVFYVRCIPDENKGTKGTTKIFRVRQDGDELLDSYGWYAPRGVVLGWSPVSGQVAVMSMTGEEETTRIDAIQFSFHMGGKLLRAYTTEDLRKLQFHIPENRRIGSSAFRVIGCEQVPRTNRYVFSIDDYNGRKVSFDITSGQPTDLLAESPYSSEVERLHTLPPASEIQLSVIATTPPATPSIPGLSDNGSRPDDSDSDKNPIRTGRGNRGARTHPGSLYIGFAFDPLHGNYDGVVGSSDDVWNFVDVGTTAVDYMRHPNATSSTARLRITRHDGEWAVKTENQIFRGYIYHNCQCVDLEATLLDVAPGRYRAYVYAHGDAPNQNANIEVIVGDQSIGKKATANDGTWEFQSSQLKQGVQYVTFEFDVTARDEIHFVSHRDGSNYSMLNAIQIVPLSRAGDDELQPEAHDTAEADQIEASNSIIASKSDRLLAKAKARDLAESISSNLRQLEEALLYNDEATRWAAQDALVELKECAVPVLVKVLRDGDERAREHAANGLQRIGRPAAAAIPVLLESLGRDITTTSAAARALSTVGQGSVFVRDELERASVKEIPSGGAIEASINTIQESLDVSAED